MTSVFQTRFRFLCCFLLTAAFALSVSAQIIKKLPD